MYGSRIRLYSHDRYLEFLLFAVIYHIVLTLDLSLSLLFHFSSLPITISNSFFLDFFPPLTILESSYPFSFSVTLKGKRRRDSKEEKASEKGERDRVKIYIHTFDSSDGSTTRSEPLAHCFATMIRLVSTAPPPDC